MKLAAAWTACSMAAALDNGVGRTPPMGYNTWNDFRCNGITAYNVRKVADAIVGFGLDKVGYNYVGIDDCWAVSRNPETGVIVEDPKAFPDGMKAVADYVHAKGLKFGIYTDRGTATCVGRPGSQGYENIDAETYARWGVDLVKEDSCSAPADHAEAFRQYGLMRDALNATGRPIYFALCGWSDWYAPEGRHLGNSWRYGYDVNDWSSAWSNSISASTRLARYAGPGAWNDPDALIGSSPDSAVHMSPAQSRTQFSLWAIMAAPLMIGSNVLSPSPYDLETYTNLEVIAVDQDPLGIQGKVIWDSCGGVDAWHAFQRHPEGRSQERRAFAAGTSIVGSCAPIPACQQIWLRQLHDGYAVAFVNYTHAEGPVHENADGGALVLESCDVKDELQLWNVHTAGGMSTIAALSGNKACWEINGCNYKAGASVDTDFGCKALPVPGLQDPCCSNMAWRLRADGSITPVAASHLCFEVASGGGGTLAMCNSSRSQKWQLQGEAGRQQIVSSTGSGCVSRATHSRAGHPARLQRQQLDAVEFDITETLGWDAAQVRDLWTHQDLGTQNKITVSLDGDGDSKLFKLTAPTSTLAYV